MPRSLLRWALRQVTRRSASTVMLGLLSVSLSGDWQAPLMAAGPKSKPPKTKADRADKGDKDDSSDEKSTAPGKSGSSKPATPAEPPKLSLPKITPPKATPRTTAQGRGSETKVATRTDDTVQSIAVKIASDHPLQPVLKSLRASQTALGEIRDYSAILAKRELIGTKLISQKMELKVRETPFSVYIKFLTTHTGREVIFVAGKNDGQLLVHETGFASLAGTLSFLPTSRQAMADNRYPVTQIGMANLLQTILLQLETDARIPEAQVRITAVKLENQSCQLLEVIHPQQREPFRFHKTRVYLSEATRLPVQVEQYGWPTKPGQEPPLHEEYIYSQVRTNVNLTDTDFDEHNPAYNF